VTLCGIKPSNRQFIECQLCKIVSESMRASTTPICDEFFNLAGIGIELVDVPIVLSQVKFGTVRLR
jgi:hypothetical protein